MKVCVPRYLPREDWERSIERAIEVRPSNCPDGFDTGTALGEPGGKAALDIFRYWGEAGVELTVGFIETPDAALRARILSHMSSWGETANVSFVESNVDPQVRIARFTAAEAGPGRDGYWSYLGTDILLVSTGPTMNLEAFTMNTPESEFRRVVRHEAGHTLGFPHEHMRKELVERLDREKVIAAYMASQGWSRQEVIDQVLIPLEEASLLGTAHADVTSIMCYQIAAELTRDGRPIPGGLDINAGDRAFAAIVYPSPDPRPVRTPEDSPTPSRDGSPVSPRDVWPDRPPDESSNRHEGDNPEAPDSGVPSSDPPAPPPDAWPTPR